MAKGNRRFFEERELEEILSVNSDADVKKIKHEISNYVPKEIKVIARNENQKKLINHQSYANFLQKHTNLLESKLTS